MWLVGHNRPWQALSCDIMWGILCYGSVKLIDVLISIHILFLDYFYTKFYLQIYSYCDFFSTGCKLHHPCSKWLPISPLCAILGCNRMKILSVKINWSIRLYLYLWYCVSLFVCLYLSIKCLVSVFCLLSLCVTNCPYFCVFICITRLFCKCLMTSLCI